LFMIRNAPRVPYIRPVREAVQDLVGMFEGRGSRLLRVLLGPTYRLPEQVHVDV